MQQQSNRQRKSSLKKLRFRNEDERGDSTKSNETKSVQFSTIEIRDYSLCLGDHPDVNRGAPVSLDWEYESEQSFDLEEYEQRSFGKGRKSQQDMIRRAFEREYTLQKLGYSKEEIETRSKIAKKDRKKRSQTRRTMIFEPLMIMSEETKRWIEKRKTRHNEIVKESGDSISSASSTSDISSGFAPGEDFMEKNVIVCSQ